MKILGSTLLLLFALHLSGCKAPTSRDDEIYDAIVRHQVKTWDLPAESFCVSIKGQDANEKLLQQLNLPHVKAQSSCERIIKSGFLTEIVDKQSGKRAVIFDAGQVRHLTQTEVEVDGGYQCGALCMGSGVYRLVYDGKNWIVKEFKIEVIS